jgi:hypothetical protein
MTLVLGDNHRLREKLREHGVHADAEVLESKERPWVTRQPGEIGAWGTYRLKLEVRPGDAPPFTVEITDQWQAVGEPRAGMKVPVLFDADHPSKVVLDASPGRYALLDPSVMGQDDFEDPELAALNALDAAEGTAAPAGASQSRLDQLQQLADLHDRGVLTDDEFAAEKAKILAG